MLMNFCRSYALAVVLCFIAGSFALAQRDKPVPGELKVKPGKETPSASETATPESKETKDRDKEKNKDEEKEPPPSVSEHTLTVGGKTIHYRATTGYMVMRDWSEKKKPEEGEGERSREPGREPTATPSKESDKSKDKDKDKDEPKQKAKVFYVAYTRTDVGNDPTKRPITFSFNGGPGSASVWLHLGALGPRRTELTDRGEAPLAPYHLVDNEATWLDATDLVFIDPVSTGYSRSAPGEDPKQFHGFNPRPRQRGRFHPALHLAEYALGVAKVHHRRELRHYARRGIERLFAGALRLLRQRDHPGVEHS
jgi:carboxypeptidase C (cathepsin A)